MIEEDLSDFFKIFSEEKSKIKKQKEASENLGITIQGISYRMKNWGPERGYEYV